MGAVGQCEVATADDPPAEAGRPRAVGPWVAATLFAVLVIACAVLEFRAAAVWEVVRDNLDAWQAWVGRHLVPAVVIFFLVYAVATALPLPVVTVMSLLAGAFFGRYVGTAVASLAYTTGVTTAFLVSRWLLRDWVRARFGRRLRRVDRGVRRDGPYYLLTLRLMPTIPFFLVSLLMALTPIRTRSYVLVSWLGVLPITFLYTAVGTELAALESPADILSWSVLGSLAALAVVPLLFRTLIRWRAWRRPT